MAKNKWAVNGLVALVALFGVGLSACSSNADDSATDSKAKSSQTDTKKADKKSDKPSFKIGKGTLTYGKNAVSSSDGSSDEDKSSSSSVQGDPGELNHYDDDDPEKPQIDFEKDTTGDTDDNQSDKLTSVGNGYYRDGNNQLVDKNRKLLLASTVVAAKIANNSSNVKNAIKQFTDEGFEFSDPNVYVNQFNGEVEVEYEGSEDDTYVEVTATVSTDGTLHVEGHEKSSDNVVDTTENWFDEGLYK